MSARTIRANLLFKQRRFLEAESEIRSALANGEQTAELHALLGLYLRTANLHEQALIEGKKALEVDPESGYAHYAFSYIAQGNPRKKLFNLSTCQKSIRRALELSPDDPRYLVRQAELYQSNQQWKASFAPLEAALRIAPAHVGAAVLRAEALMQLNRRAEASETLVRALESDPEASLAHAGMGWALLRTGEHERATAFFEEALRLHPEMDWAQRGALECAKHRFWIHRAITWPSRRFPNRPLVRLLISVFGMLVPIGSVLWLLIWLGPVLKPRIGGDTVAIIFIPLLALAVASVILYDQIFFWLVHKQRAARTQTGERLREDYWLKAVTAGVAGVIVIFALMLQKSSPAASSMALGLAPGIISLLLVKMHTPECNARTWLIVYSVILLAAGPVVAITCHEYLEELGSRTVAAVMALPLVPVAIADSYIIKRLEAKQHEQKIERSRRKLET